MGKGNLGRVLIPLLVLVMAFGLVTPVAAQPAATAKVLIGFIDKPGPSEQAIVKEVGGIIKYTYHLIPSIAAMVPERAISKLRGNPKITHVNRDTTVYAIEQSLPWGVDRIDAEVVHATNKGTGVKVAILDTGIDLDHPDLNVAGGMNFASGKGYDDKNGHGTHVAGIVAALDNGIGVIGVAPEVALYAVKVLGNGGRGNWSDIIAGIEWSVDNGMEVANMSLGATSAPSEVVAASEAAYAAGLVLVAAAGNDYGGPVIYPAAYTSVIAVSATDSGDKLASFSSIGAEVELAGPGAGIYSTYKGGGYATMSGTSMSSPHVAGTAALVIASGVSDVDGVNVTANEVRDRLNTTAEDMGATGWDPKYGNGLVDAENAVLGTTSGNNLIPPATGSIAGTVTDTDTTDPIEGATVTANGYSTTTAADGTYTLADLPVGSYTVTASATGYTDQSKTSDVLKNQTTVVNFTLTPAVTPTGTMSADSITFSAKKSGPNLFLYTTAKVLLEDGSAVDGARVEMTLTYVSGSSWNFAGDTGSDGTVKFTLLRARTGDYTAKVTRVSHTDYAWDGIETTGSCTLNSDGTVTQ